MPVRVTDCCERIFADPEIYRIRLPFTNIGAGVSNCYLVRSGSEWLMVDSGAAGMANRRRLAESMRVVGFDHRKATAFLTHAHFDHAGLMTDVLGYSTVLMVSRTAYESRSLHAGDLQRLFIRRMLAMGASMDEACSYAAVNSESAVLDLRSLNMVFAEDGDVFAVGSLTFEVLATPGHTADHLSLFCRESGLLFSGDAVLKRSAPSLDSQPGCEDALRTYFDTLGRLLSVPVSYALPGHGEVLGGPEAFRSQPLQEALNARGASEPSECAFHEAIHAGMRKKAVKLERVSAAVIEAPFANGQQIARIVNGRRSAESWYAADATLRYYALLETFVLLQHLVAAGDLMRVVDDDGVYRYAVNGAWNLI